MIDISSEAPPSNQDRLSQLLMGMRLFGVCYRHVQAEVPFGLSYSHQPGRSQLHVVIEGELELRTASGYQRLVAGDALLLPRSQEHALLSERELACADILSLDAEPVCDHFGCLGDNPNSSHRFFSACMAMDLGPMQPLVVQMPEVIHVGTLLDRYPELGAILDAMRRESSLMRAGAAGILSRLAEVLAATLIRGWVECQCANSTGWIQAINDPRMGTLLSALHQDPGQSWTVASMASHIGMSRSVFAERFKAMTGLTPLTYVSELRMQLARQWLEQDKMALSEVVYRLGYGSSSAFSRAFKKATGQTPGALRSR